MLLFQTSDSETGVKEREELWTMIKQKKKKRVEEDK